VASNHSVHILHIHYIHYGWIWPRNAAARGNVGRYLGRPSIERQCWGFAAAAAHVIAILYTHCRGSEHTQLSSPCNQLWLLLPSEGQKLWRLDLDGDRRLRKRCSRQHEVFHYCFWYLGEQCTACLASYPRARGGGPRRRQSMEHIAYTYHCTGSAASRGCAASAASPRRSRRRERRGRHPCHLQFRSQRTFLLSLSAPHCRYTCYSESRMSRSLLTRL